MGGPQGAEGADGGGPWKCLEAFGIVWGASEGSWGDVGAPGHIWGLFGGCVPIGRILGGVPGVFGGVLKVYGGTWSPGGIWRILEVSGVIGVPWHIYLGSLGVLGGS